MIKHCIMIKLKDNSPDAKKEAKEKLLSMNGRVPQISDLEVITDIIGSERSYDVLLSCLVEDEAALDAYQNDPYHCEIKVYVRQVSTSVIAVDAVI